MRSTTPSCYEKPQKKTRKMMVVVNNGVDGAVSAVLSVSHEGFSQWQLVSAFITPLNYCIRLHAHIILHH